jgi:translation elongation factor EF-Tu-like GTPase
MPITTSFEVAGHFELTERGAFVIGQIVSGIWRIGDRVSTIGGDAKFTIAGIECLDYISLKKSAIALVFVERPTLEQIQRAFPCGTTLTIAE